MGDENEPELGKASGKRVSNRSVPKLDWSEIISGSKILFELLFGKLTCTLLKSQLFRRPTRFAADLRALMQTSLRRTPKAQIFGSLEEFCSL